MRTTVYLRDGRQITLRRPVIADVAAYDRLNRAIVSAGQGTVMETRELPPDAARIAKTIAQAIDRAAEDLVLLAEADAETLAGSIEVVRMPWAGIRHNAILSMGVHPDWQGVGLGRYLMDAALDWARAKGVLRVELYVLGDNLRARSLYTSVGFVPVYHRERFLRRSNGAWVDDTVMVWEADPVGAAGRHNQAAPAREEEREG